MKIKHGNININIDGNVERRYLKAAALIVAELANDAIRKGIVTEVFNRNGIDTLQQISELRDMIDKFGEL